MNKQTQKALDIAKEALFLIRASDPAYNAKTTYRITNHERFGELLREFFEVEDIIRQAHTEQNLNKHLVMQAEGSDGAKEAAVGNSAAGQSGSDGVMKWCDSCGKITKWIDGDCENYKTRGGSAKGTLPR